MTRLLVTGSRTWTDARFLRDALNAAFYQRPDKDTSITLVHGACPTGADAIADQWARDYGCVGNPIRIERHPADWFTYGKAAGHRRNAEMVSLGAYLCVAFIEPCTSRICRRPDPHGSHGATGCAELAKAAGIPTVIYRSDVDGAS